MAEREAVAFEVMARRCDQCLMGPDRIVSGERAAEIIRETRAADISFICHRASIAGRDRIACRGHHDQYPCRAARFAAYHAIPFREIDPDTLETVSEGLVPLSILKGTP